MAALAAVVHRMSLAGEGLSAGTLQWGRREGAEPAVCLTDRDLRLMALIYDVNLDRFRPISERGSAEWNYRLSSLGWSALTERGMTPSDRTHTPAAITSISYTEHDLQLAALVLRIAQEAAGKRDGGLIDRMPFTWKGPRSGRIDTDGSRDFEWSPAAELPEGTRLHAEGSREGYLEPDATLIGCTGDDRWAVLIEYDRTERPNKQIDLYADTITGCSAAGERVTLLHTQSLRR
jgi:hypothetical protein